MSQAIMVVDDSPSVRRLMGFSLTSANYRVVEAANGHEALELFEREDISMVITDLNMPKMNGLQLIKELRGGRASRFMPIVLLTSESEQENRQQSKEVGASAWLNKPFKPNQLLQMVRMVLPN
ncbi:MAG: two-component system response regulator [Desulfuromonas sp.]|nr:MAG: two-component system response regulator [Desulfuromonas sp.]